jgi:hypothetical protein
MDHRFSINKRIQLYPIFIFKSIDRSELLDIFWWTGDNHIYRHLGGEFPAQDFLGEVGKTHQVSFEGQNVMHNFQVSRIIKAYPEKYPLELPE